MNNITMSVALSEIGKIERCICCNSKSDVRRLNFWSTDDVHGKDVVLCLNCRRELFSLLQADDSLIF